MLPATAAPPPPTAVRSRLDDGGWRYNVGLYVRLRGALDEELFEAALRRTVAGSETLRVRFEGTGPEVAQVLDPAADWPLVRRDFSGHERPRAAAVEFMERTQAVPYGVGVAPLPRAHQERLRRGAAALAVSTSALFPAALAMVLHADTGARKPVVGLVVRGRDGSAVQEAMGVASHVLPLRLPVDPAASVGELVHATAARIRAVLPHQRHRMADLLRENPALLGEGRLTGPALNPVTLTLGTCTAFAAVRPLRSQESAVRRSPPRERRMIPASLSSRCPPP
ncbi:hypothetical protein KGS77_34075 [Streptomyces sp. MST-110588]|nr:hypothetical protein KGS77_34075 [Streptomyces sp. MST-110588]